MHGNRKENIEQWIGAELQGTPHFLVRLVANAQGTKITAQIDGDMGVTIDDCASLSRRISRRIDEEDTSNGKFTFEVTSPGVDQPILFLRQLHQHVGRDLKIEIGEGQKLKGTLTAVGAVDLTLMPLPDKKNKKEKLASMVLPFDTLKEVKVMISFKSPKK